MLDKNSVTTEKIRDNSVTFDKLDKNTVALPLIQLVNSYHLMIMYLTRILK